LFSAIEPHLVLKEGGALITYSIHHTFISDFNMYNVKKGITLIGRRKREVKIK
jgi:hypothetical protein